MNALKGKTPRVKIREAYKHRHIAMAFCSTHANELEGGGHIAEVTAIIRGAWSPSSLKLEFVVLHLSPLHEGI